MPDVNELLDALPPDQRELALAEFTHMLNLMGLRHDRPIALKVICEDGRVVDIQVLEGTRKDTEDAV